MNSARMGDPKPANPESLTWETMTLNSWNTGLRPCARRACAPFELDRPVRVRACLQGNHDAPPRLHPAREHACDYFELPADTILVLFQTIWQKVQWLAQSIFAHDRRPLPRYDQWRSLLVCQCGCRFYFRTVCIRGRAIPNPRGCALPYGCKHLWREGANMVKIWLILPSFQFYVGAAAPTTLNIDPSMFGFLELNSL